MSVAISAVGLDSFADLGDYRSAADDLFDSLRKKPGGVSGNALRAALQHLVAIAHSATKKTRDVFMYEVEKRPELQTDAAVPDWLLTQIRDRVKAVIGETKVRLEAEVLIKTIKGNLSAASATAAVPTVDVSAAGRARHRGGFPWLWLGAGVLVAGAVGFLLLRRQRVAPAAPAPAVSGLGRHRRRWGR